MSKNKDRLEEQVLDCQFKSASEQQTPGTSVAAIGNEAAAGLDSKQEQSTSVEVPDARLRQSLQTQLKQLEKTLSELRLKTGLSGTKNANFTGGTNKMTKRADNLATFGIVPPTFPLAELFQSSPESMFPPALVFLICIVSFLSAKIL